MYLIYYYINHVRWVNIMEFY